MAGYVLLAVDLLLVALLLTVAGYLAAGLLRLARSNRRGIPACASAGELTWRRCESCKGRWQAQPGSEVSATGLRLRRAVRRVARTRQRTVAWARPQGWSRCPRCLSTRVRDSRRQTAR